MTSSVEPLGIGERLRNAREARGWSLADVAELTRIRPTYLEALEEEQFDRLPGRTYMRGFLRTYATALGLDPDELFEAYHLEFDMSAQPIMGVHSVEVPIRPAARPSPLRRFLILAALVALVLALILGYIGIQQFRRFAAPAARPESPSQPAPTASPNPASAQSEPLAQSPTTPRPRPAEPQPTPLPAGPVTVVLRATEESWIRISADGERVFQGFITAGEERTWRAQRTLTVRIGNAQGVSVEVNGQPVQPPSRRRVYERIFTAP